MTDPRTVHVVVEQKPSNGLGIAGFVVSLVGLLCTVGVLSPLGLLLSFIALFKAPRGFAIAGVVVGLVGSVLGAVVGVALWMAWLGFEKAAEELGPHFSTATELVAVQGELHRAYDSSGDPPSEEKGNAIASTHLDGWGRPFRYLPPAAGQEFWWRIESAGPDGAFGTPDDVMHEETR